MGNSEQTYFMEGLRQSCPRARQEFRRFTISQTEGLERGVGQKVSDVVQLNSTSFYLQSGLLIGFIGDQCSRLRIPKPVTMPFHASALRGAIKRDLETIEKAIERSDKSMRASKTQGELWG